MFKKFVGYGIDLPPLEQHSGPRSSDNTGPLHRSLVGQEGQEVTVTPWTPREAVLFHHDSAQYDTRPLAFGLCDIYRYPSHGVYRSGRRHFRRSLYVLSRCIVPQE